MSSLVLGTVQFGLDYGINNRQGRPDQDSISEILSMAWKNGIKELDTAQAYGDSEEKLGRSLKTFPNEFLIHSKFIADERSFPEALESSLARLGTPQLGYFYFHRFSDFLSRRNDLADPGAESLGLAVSVYDEEELEACLGVDRVRAVQVPLNILDCSDRKLRQLELLRAEGKKIYLRSVFLQGLFFMNPDELPTRIRELAAPLREIQSMAREFSLDMRSLALGFVRSLTPQDKIIIGVDGVEQLTENLSAFETILAPEMVLRLRQIKVENRALLLPKNWA